MSQPGYAMVYTNYRTATQSMCDDCHFYMGDTFTPLVKRSQSVASSRGILGFGGNLRGRFAEQYTITIGAENKLCTGIIRVSVLTLSHAEPGLDKGSNRNL